ncbi:MAG TPA: glycerate kinase, partial [Candidatus Acidoferrales bacterium]|nr:glycerate kinase [Candidatus Acidoferrales bacterium]
MVAPDKFKGSLSSRTAAEAIGRGLGRALPQAKLDLVPVADGGDGTAETIVHSLGGQMIVCDVHGPDGKPVQARYGLLEGSKVAVIELAQASGLALIPVGNNDPLTASTLGTGQLIGTAIDAGAERIILAIGGSATNDAGAGALSALGAKFLDDQGRSLSPGGAALAKLASIDTTALDKRLAGIIIEIASDVRNPLCGPSGASAVYGPQKGASPKDVRLLDAALARFADVAKTKVGIDVRDVPGAGAAGGVGAGFLALAHATLRPGAQLVLEVLDFEQHLAGATLVITGEGRLDKQTLAGKAPYAVAQAAAAHKIPVVALAGSVECSAADLEEASIAFALPIVSGPMTVEEAMQRGAELLASTAYTLGRSLSL